MSSTIYSGKTINGMNVDDMVDDNRDYVLWSKDKRYFGRISCKRDSIEDKPTPAFVIFSTDKPYDPLWGADLVGEYDDYLNEFGYNYNEMKFNGITLNTDEVVDYFVKEYSHDVIPK